MSPILIDHHLGNRRFRFIVTLYRDRYVCASSRKAKRMVVYSIVNQVHAAGGRFLVRNKYFNNGELWTSVSPTIAREKVSHALRDKYPLDTQGSVFCRLKAEITNLTLRLGVKDDCLYDLITSFILSTALPRMEHASDNYIEDILFQRIAQQFKYHVMMLHKQIVSPKHTAHHKSMTISKPRACDKIHNTCVSSLVEYTIKSEYLKICNHDLSADNQSRWISIAPEIDLKYPFSWFVERDNEFQISFSEQMDSNMDHKFSDFEFSNGDLPESFSEKDCEDLISTL
jgi:hypothetical protein